MANIIFQQQTITKMFPGQALGVITNGVTAAIGKSFDEQNMRNPTQSEIKRRFGICMKWAQILRGDLEWSIQRIVDELPNILRHELLGQPYTPPKREIWAPGAIPNLS